MNTLLALQVENTNICNAHCIFCPHDKFKEFGTMTDDLYNKIVIEASKLPALGLFIPMLTGEPFCDPKFLERLKLAREKLKCRIEFYTNGSFLTREAVDFIKPLDIHINVSINGATPLTRQKLMGLGDFYKVMRVLKYCEEIGQPYRASLVGHPEVKPKEVSIFVKAGGSAFQYQSWAGRVYPHERKGWRSCVRAQNYMTVRYNGDTCLCCFDPFGEVTFGNVEKESIEQVWTSSLHREYQEKHKTGRGNEFELCRHCTEG